MTAIRIIDDHVQLASIGLKTHAQIEGHIQGIGSYAFPAADGAADQVLKTNGAGVLAWIDKNHSIASHNDTTATGAELETLTDNSIADALHRHSELVASDGSPDPALSVDATGQVGIWTLTPAALLDVSGTGVVAIFGDGTGTVGINFNGAAGNVRDMAFRSAGSARWILRTDSIAESGSNAGSNFHIIRRADDGSNLGAVLFIKRSNGNIGIGTITPATSAKLELSSTTGALLLTRMTTTQKNALTAVNGMLVYDSTLNKFQGYEGGAWTSLI